MNLDGFIEKRMGLCIVFLGFAIISLYFLWVPEPPGARALIAEQTAFWKTRITAVGGRKAYEEYASSVASSTPNAQHEGAHVFGRALFEAEGAQGISVCDNRFSYGCFHEFLGRAIATMGLGSVESLNDGCWSTLTTSPLSCQHGIGHGIIGYLGYDDASLRKALEVCARLKHNDPIGGCYGGVFMEYNMRTLLGPEGRARAATPDTLAPCDQLPKKYTGACYFWQSEWWHNILVQKRLSESAAYKQMGAWCTEAGPSYARDCFQGIGNNLPPDANWDAAEIRRLCESVSTNRFNQLYCKALAADSLLNGGSGKKGDSQGVCKGLPNKEREYCAAYATNEANIAKQLATP